MNSHGLKTNTGYHFPLPHRLHNFQAQEAYYTKIVERYMKFCAVSSSAGGEGLEKAFASLSLLSNTDTSSGAPPNTSNAEDIAAHRPSLPRQTSTTPRPNDMPHILLAMRKLREAILATRRRDAFAQRAYKFLIQAAILTKNWESYQPALLYLLHHIHPCTPLGPTELQDYGGYLVLDLACRQWELGEAFVVRKRLGVRERKVDAVLRALVRDDWVRFWRLRRSVDGYQRAVMEFGVERMRVHALKCLGRGYLSVERGYVERVADGSWEQLVKGGVGWELGEDGRVVIRRIKAKANG